MVGDDLVEQRLLVGEVVIQRGVGDSASLSNIADRDGSPKKLKQPYVDPRLCIGCGICENKCPVEDLAAIRVSSVGETRSESNQMILERF